MEKLEDKKIEKLQPKSPFIKRFYTAIRKEEDISELSSPEPEINLFTIEKDKL